MNLIPVKMPEDKTNPAWKLRATCKCCDDVFPIFEMKANMQGEAFKGYYCPQCVKEIEKPLDIPKKM